MKLHVLSDLHTEFGAFSLPEVGADVLILAGDVGVGNRGLAFAAQAARPVVYVPGNHEFYRQDLSLLAELRRAAPPKVHLLEDEEVRIGGVRFLGTMLWTDFALFGAEERELAMLRAAMMMNDFRLIADHGAAFTPAAAYRRHRASRAWLEARLAEPFGGPTVVVTHHAPSAHSVPGRYAGDLLSAAYASDLEALITRHRPALWIHGHTHTSYDYKIAATRVVCNPRGYFPQALNPDFDPALVVEVV